MLKSAITAVVVLGLPTSAATQTLTGNDVLSVCTMNDNAAAAGFCSGYVIGGIEGLKWGAISVLIWSLESTDAQAEALNAATNTALGHCIPQNATHEQLRDVFLSYLQEHPATRHETARTLLQDALVAAFPC